MTPRTNRNYDKNINCNQSRIGRNCKFKYLNKRAFRATDKAFKHTKYKNDNYPIHAHPLGETDFLKENFTFYEREPKRFRSPSSSHHHQKIQNYGYVHDDGYEDKFNKFQFENKEHWKRGLWYNPIAENLIGPSYNMYDMLKFYEEPIDKYKETSPYIMGDFPNYEYTNKNNDISHITHEYYLIGINKKYPFTCTVNELLTIDREKLSNLIKDINSYFKKLRFPLLKKLDLVDYTIYSNELICVTSPKACISTLNKDNKRVYAREILINSKYPTNQKDAKIITSVCSKVYHTIVDMKLQTNGRLIKEKELPEDLKFGYNKISKHGDSYSYHYFDIGKNSTLFSLQNIYNPYLDIDLLYNEFKKSDDKLIILHGETGSGKTKISSILSYKFIKENYICYILPGTFVDDEYLWGFLDNIFYDSLKRLESVIIIIDDVDPKNLTRATEYENKFFNNLLVLLDGNVDIDTKIIITTNTYLMDKLDEPLYRAGRLFDIINVRYLTKKEAIAVLEFNDLNEKEIEDFFKNEYSNTTNDGELLYRQADISQYLKEVKRNISRKYLKDDSEDLRQDRILTKNKIGF